VLPMRVRRAEPGDVPGLVALTLEGRRESLVGNQVCASDEDVVGRHLAVYAGAPGAVVLLAEDEGGRIAGLLLGRVVGANPFTDEPSLVVEAVYVAADARRRGVGHALMCDAAEIAHDEGVADVYAAPIPGARGMQRFFVQLGFTPAASHRTIPLAALRRRLSADGGPSRRRSVHRGLEDLIARRRQSRMATGEIPVVAPGVDSQDPSADKRRQVSRAVHSRLPAESSTTIS
jgi:GNAT superfamily N-acetyltransferase